MSHKLTRLSARHGETEAIDDVVQPALEHEKQVFAGHAALLSCLLKIVPELAFEQIVDRLTALLLAKLLAISNQLAASGVMPVLPRRLRSTLLDGAGGLVALLPFEKQLHSFAPAKATLFASISSQLYPPLRPPGRDTLSQ
jgi:hypothetical protein